MKRLMLLMTVLATAAAAANDRAGPSDTLRVEIPLRNGYISHHETIKINRLMDQRTYVEPSGYRLKAVVLYARADRDGYAQLKIRGDYSPQVHIPHGDGAADGLFKVRVSAPDNPGHGTWRLRVSGGVYIGRLVAVLEPRHRYSTRYRHDPYRYGTPLSGRYHDHEDRHARREHDADKRNRHRVDKGDEQVSWLSRGSRTSRQGRTSLRAGELNTVAVVRP